MICLSLPNKRCLVVCLAICCGAVLLAAPLLAKAQAQACNPNTPRTVPDTRYSAVSDGAEVKDAGTALIWQRCSAGQRWNGKTCLGRTEAYAWATAQEVAGRALTSSGRASMPFPGTADRSSASSAMVSPLLPAAIWRLPTHKELHTLIEQACRNPAINTVWFPGTRAGFYWSASTFSDDSNFAWGVDFSDGSGSYDAKAGAYSVRLVRSGP